MQHHRITLALAVLAALLIAPRTTQAQFSFGHFGDFSSAQGAPAQFSTTAPGMYASGQYLTAGPWDYPLGNMNQPGPYPLYRRTVYVPPSQTNGNGQNTYRAGSSTPGGNATTNGQGSANPYRPYEAGGAPAYAAPRPVNPTAPLPAALEEGPGPVLLQSRFRGRVRGGPDPARLGAPTEDAAVRLWLLLRRPREWGATDLLMQAVPRTGWPWPSSVA